MVTACCDEYEKENVPSLWSVTFLPRSVFPATYVELPVHCVSFAYGIAKSTRLPLFLTVSLIVRFCEVLPLYLPVRALASAAEAAVARMAVAMRVRTRARSALRMTGASFRSFARERVGNRTRRWSCARCLAEFAPDGKGYRMCARCPVARDAAGRLCAH